ncbi:hypothetical protein PsorP6_002273 [Peronosclerospora sorghi]|uniref:Uncharacterized protein n=1 Tax=Peronosclerospora sorghi TaxID=230839 RepID=A0ACC0WWN3_9STRA|nr:hypothetical protein PsorP6_002273 [Peronosclerospora sorghi]
MEWSGHTGVDIARTLKRTQSRGTKPNTTKERTARPYPDIRSSRRIPDRKARMADPVSTRLGPDPSWQEIYSSIFSTPVGSKPDLKAGLEHNMLLFSIFLGRISSGSRLISENIASNTRF